MLCPRCLAATSVKDSRPQENGTTRRRRICENGHKFSTWESTVDPAPALRRLEEARKRAARRWAAMTPEQRLADRRRRESRSEARKQASEERVPPEAIYARWGLT